MRQRLVLLLIVLCTCKPSAEGVKAQRLLSRYSSLISSFQLKPMLANTDSKSLSLKNASGDLQLFIGSNLTDSIQLFFNIRKEFMKGENKHLIKNEVTSNFWYNQSSKKGLILFDSAVVKLESLARVNDLQKIISENFSSTEFKELSNSFRILPGNSRIGLTERYQTDYSVGGLRLQNCLIANYSWDANGRMYTCLYENKKAAARKLYDLQKASLQKNPKEKADLRRRPYREGDGIAYFYTQEPNKSCNGFYNYRRFIFGIEGVNSLSMCKALVNEMIGNL